MRILGIETSCDETAAAVLEVAGTWKSPRFRVPSNIVSSQIAIHKKFGGVVPNLAKREHQKNLVPVLITALKKSLLYQKVSTPILRSIGVYENIFSHEPLLLKQFLTAIPAIKPPKIDAIAVTYGPGLAPALWTGVNFARALALIWGKPLIPVNHLEGHIYVNVLRQQPLKFPALALIVSGGHTELVLMKKHLHYRIIGETRDDAAGEAFDKVARLLGLGYPGGPVVSALADRIKNQELGIKVKLPRPMLNSNDFDFSFSGLKTAVLYYLRDLRHPISQKIKAAIAREFQDAVVDVLVAKAIRAAKTFKVKTVVIGGGVAANKLLRERLADAAIKELPHARLLLPEAKEATDNALMIAAAAFFRKKRISARSSRELRADPGLRLGRYRVRANWRS